ncbi:MAG: 1-acyl-sn-glycerol-3-phosphate acyltransferase [Spirochaetes bacterium]|nr:1-acyl-sn-glycerol-3-phosphate acyltransferase [Spirochaetota bacterium]
MPKDVPDKITFFHWFYTFWGYLMFVLVNIMQIIIAPFVFLITLPFDKNRKVIAYMIKFFCEIFYFLNFVQRNHFDFGDLKAPAKGERRIYVLNHCSIFDVIAMYALPGAIKSVMKESYLKIPLVGLVSLLAGNIIMKTSPQDRIKAYYETVHKLENGSSLAIYPEGTKSKDSKIGKFQNGSFKIAKETKADIVPVIFDGWNVIRPLSFWIRDTHVHLKTLDPIPYEEYQDMKLSELSQYVRNKMITALLDIRDQRRKNEKSYYRLHPKYIELDNQMRQEIS